MAAVRKEAYLESVKHLPNQQPHKQPNGQPVIRRRVVTKPKRSLYSFKMIITLCAVGVFALAFMHLYMLSQINHAHYAVQQTRNEIVRQTNINEQLNVQISELSQNARMIEIALEHGLYFFEENIVNIAR